VRYLLPVALAVLAAGCGGSGTAAPDLPAPLEASLLPQLSARDRDLPVGALAADAYAPEELASLLREGGYLGGRERELSGHTETYDHVVARTLRFSHPTGAARYVDWVAAHTLDLVGRTRPLEPLPAGEDARLFELEPCATCKKQLPTLLAVWRRAGSVGYVLASGRDVDRATLAPLAGAVDGTL
jgi:hypothetical protein